MMNELSVQRKELKKENQSRPKKEGKKNNDWRKG